MQVVDRAGRAAVLAGDEVVHHAGLQRPRPEQGDQRDDVVEAVGLELAHEIRDAARLQLEDRGRAAGLQELEGLRVVERQARKVNRRLARGEAFRIDEPHRPVDDGERAKAEEVELDEPDLLDVVLVELGDDARAARFAVERGEVRERARRDHDAARVRAGVAGEALEPLRKLDEVAHLVLGAEAPRKLGLLLERVLERDPELERDQLRDAIDKAVRKAEHAADVAHDRPRRERAERDDLGHPVAPVAVRDVVDDLVAPRHAEVDVEVRQRHALRIQEALEQEVVPDRVEVRDPEHPGDERARAGAAARADRDLALARPADEVRDHEEIALETHAADDAEFLVEPRAVTLDLLRGGADPACEPLFRQAAQVGRRAAAVRHFEGGHEDAALRERQRAALCDLDACSGSPRAGPRKAPPSRPATSGIAPASSAADDPGRRGAGPPGYRPVPRVPRTRRGRGSARRWSQRRAPRGRRRAPARPRCAPLRLAGRCAGLPGSSGRRKSPASARGPQRLPRRGQWPAAGRRRPGRRPTGRSARRSSCRRAIRARRAAGRVPGPPGSCATPAA